MVSHGRWTLLVADIDDFTLFEAQLNAADVDWIAEATDRPSGRFATFKDPDGNYLQVIQFAQPSS